MSDGAQLPLAFDHKPAMGGVDFLVAASNAEAVAWLRRWPRWPTPILILHGPPGCGKTHLARAFAEDSGAALVDPRVLAGGDPLALFERVPAAVVDDAERCVGVAGGTGGGTGGGEAGLLHLINAAGERGRTVLLTGGEPPARWPVALADLRSRLNAGCTVRINEPDDNLMRAVLGKLFVDRQLRVGEDVLSYLLARMERSLAVARSLVQRIDAAALAQRRAVTIPLARDVLSRSQIDSGLDQAPP